MKHLLIILSFLLLSSPLIGQETGVLYQYESSSGFVLKSFGDGKVQPKYKGEIINGIPNGFGILTYPYGEKTVVGEWKNGKDWNTKHIKKDGTLLGKFVEGEWIGSWGVLYLGYRNGKFDFYLEKWRGLETEDNKDIGKYEGKIKNGQPNGQGTENFHSGDKYVGEYKDGEYHGQGTYTWYSGDKYVGEFKLGKPNRQGTKIYNDGNKYVGEWRDWKKNGQGTFTWYSGDKYVGEFKDGEYHGQGTFTWSEGNKYVGEYKDDQPNGQGTLTTHDGDKYVGEWKNGEKHGQGTFTLSDGKMVVGKFRKDKFWNITGFDQNGNIFGKFVNGKKIKQ